MRLTSRFVPVVAVVLLSGSVAVPFPQASANASQQARAASHSCSVAKRAYRHDVAFGQHVSRAEIAVAARTFKASKKRRSDVMAYAAARQDSHQAFRASLSIARSTLARSC